MRQSTPRPGSVAPRGFTLVEIMIVVVIIGLLAALAIPAFQRIRHASQNSRVINDFRIFAQSFEIYNTQNGTWPNNALPGQIPTTPVTMAGDFRGAVWQTTTGIGGQWNWDRNVAGVVAGLSISNFTCSDQQLAELDAKLDDGDLSTGNFQKISPTRVTLILEQ